MLVRNPEAGLNAAASFGDLVSVVVADVTNESQVQQACASGVQAFGPIHIRAAQAGPGPSEITEERIQVSGTDDQYNG